MPSTRARARSASAATTLMPSSPRKRSSPRRSSRARWPRGAFRCTLREVDLELRGTHLASRPVRRYAGDLRALVRRPGAPQGTTVLFLGTPGRAERLQDVLREDGLAVGAGTGDRRPRGRAGRAASSCPTPRSPFSPTATSSRRRSTSTAAGAAAAAQLPLRLPRPEGRRPRRPRGPRHRPLRGAGDARASAACAASSWCSSYQGGDKLKVPVETFDRVQKYASAEGARPDRGQAGQRQLGEGQEARQEGHARHGGGAPEALRRAQGPPRPRLHRREPLAARVRGEPSSTTRPATRRRPSAT